MNHLEIIQRGQFYFPASNHYGVACNVVCDRCNKTNLKCCIGWSSSDLCLSCVQTVVHAQLPQPQPHGRDDTRTRMIQFQYDRHPDPNPNDDGTLMLQKQYDPDPFDEETCTFMMSDSYK